MGEAKVNFLARLKQQADATRMSRWADVCASGSEGEEDNYEESVCVSRPGAEASGESQVAPTRMSRDALEFIPTLSMACPLASFCGFVEAADCSADVAKARAPAAEGAPTPSAEEVDEWSSIEEGTRRAGVKATKRRDGQRSQPRPAALHLNRLLVTAAPSQRADFAINTPLAALALLAVCGGDAEADDEAVWAHRIAMRQKSVALAKATREYQWLACHLSGEAEGNVPATPDATDRRMSKRRWKYCISTWRQLVCQHYMEHMEDCRGSVVSSNDDGVDSVYTAASVECRGRMTSTDDGVTSTCTGCTAISMACSTPCPSDHD